MCAGFRQCGSCVEVCAVDCILSLGGGWCWCGAAAHAARSVADCVWGPPSSTSASMSCLSRPVLPRQLRRVVSRVGILSGVYERWCFSTVHIGWGLCDCLCLVLVCRGRYGLGGVVLLLMMIMSFFCSCRTKNSLQPYTLWVLILGSNLGWDRIWAE
jgi:hypothetical protein